MLLCVVVSSALSVSVSWYFWCVCALLKTVLQTVLLPLMSVHSDNDHLISTDGISILHGLQNLAKFSAENCHCSYDELSFCD